MVLMSGRVLGFMAAFIIPIVLARVFDQLDFGTYKQLFLVYTTLFGLAQLGMAESLYYFLPFESKKGGRYVLNAWLVMAGAGLACLLILTSQAEQVAALLNNESVIRFLPYIGLYLLFMLMSVMLEIVMTVRREHVSASVSYALSDLLRACLYIMPVLFIADLEWLMTGALLFAVVRFCFTVVYLARSFGFSGLQLDKPVLKQHLAYALPFGLAGFIEILQLNFHMYAVAYRFDPVTFAIYAVGCLQVPLIDILMTSTSNVMMVNMRRQLREKRPAAVLAIWLDSVRKLALVLFPLISLLLVVAPVLIVLLFTSAYADSVPVFMVWTASSALVCLLTDGVLRVYADNRYLIFQNLIRLAIIASLIHWFIDQYALIGAVMVTTFATVVIKIMALFRISRWMNVGLIKLLPWRSLLLTLLASGGAALPALWFLHELELPSIVLLAVVSFIYLFAYAALLLLFGVMEHDERRELKNRTLVPVARLWRSLNG